jgi:hypothetical protein
MFDWIAQELTTRTAGIIIGLILGALVTWIIARWRRIQEHRKILAGDARDTIVLEHHIVETTESGGGRRPATLRIRAVGQGQLNHVVPNTHLAGELRSRASRVTAQDTLISMAGAEGSFLLETLTGFVCDRVTNAPFEHDLYTLSTTSISWPPAASRAKWPIISRSLSS